MADSTATTEQAANDVKIEDVGPARKRLTITIPPEAIAEKMEASMTTLTSEAQLPGFRKGRAPRALLQRKFGNEIRQETKGQLIADAYSSAIEEKEIKPVSEPEPVESIEDIELIEGKPLTFSVEIEVVPEFDLPSFDGLEIKKPTLEINDDHVNSEIERQQLQLGESEKIEGDFTDGDRLVGHATATIKGEDEPFFEHGEVAIVHPGKKEGGQGQVLGLLVDGVAKTIGKAKVGDTLTFETTVPEGHEREDIRGKDIVIEFQIRQGFRITPATVKQIVEHYGLADEKMLCEQVQLALTQRRDQEQANAMRQQVYDILSDTVDFELPEKMSEAQARRIVQQQEMELLYQGLTPEEIEDRLAEVRAQSMTIARNRLKLFFLMHRLSEQYGIEVSEQEINGRIAQMAMQRGMRPEQLRNELTQSNRLNEVAMQIRDHKTADHIVQDAKVKEVSSDEWKKFLEAREKKQADKGGAVAKKKKTTRKKTTKKKKKTSSKKSAG